MESAPDSLNSAPCSISVCGLGVVASSGASTALPDVTGSVAVTAAGSEPHAMQSPADATHRGKDTILAVFILDLRRAHGGLL